MAGSREDAVIGLVALEGAVDRPHDFVQAFSQLRNVHSEGAPTTLPHRRQEPDTSASTRSRRQTHHPTALRESVASTKQTYRASTATGSANTLPCRADHRLLTRRNR